MVRFLNTIDYCNSFSLFFIKHGQRLQGFFDDIGRCFACFDKLDQFSCQANLWFLIYKSFEFSIIIILFYLKSLVQRVPRGKSTPLSTDDWFDSMDAIWSRCKDDHLATLRNHGVLGID